MLRCVFKRWSCSVPFLGKILIYFSDFTGRGIEGLGAMKTCQFCRKWSFHQPLPRLASKKTSCLQQIILSGNAKVSFVGSLMMPTKLFVVLTSSRVRSNRLFVIQSRDHCKMQRILTDVMCTCLIWHWNWSVSTADSLLAISYFQILNWQ